MAALSDDDYAEVESNEWNDEFRDALSDLDDGDDEPDPAAAAPQMSLQAISAALRLDRDEDEDEDGNKSDGADDEKEHLDKEEGISSLKEAKAAAIKSVFDEIAENTRTFTVETSFALLESRGKKHARPRSASASR